MWSFDQFPGYLDCFDQKTLYSLRIQSEATHTNPCKGDGPKDAVVPRHPASQSPILSTNPPIFASHFLLSDNGAKCWGHMSRQVPALLDGANILQGKTHTKKYHQIVKGVALGNNKRVALSRKGSLGRPY